MTELFQINHWNLMILAAAGLTLVIMLVGTWFLTSAAESPGRIGAMMEVTMEFVDETIVKESLGKFSKTWVGFLATLFFFVLFGNLLGKLPIPGFESPTANINVTAALAVCVFVICQIVGVWHLGWKTYCKRKFLLPMPLVMQIIFIPLMIMVWFAEPFSLAVRLFANMVAGHRVTLAFAAMPVIGGVWLLSHPHIYVNICAALPFVFSVVLTAFELFIAFIQAFIFALLSAIYISESLHEEH